jgi:hypothetical protein
MKELLEEKKKKGPKTMIIRIKKATPDIRKDIVKILVLKNNQISMMMCLEKYSIKEGILVQPHKEVHHNVRTIS